MRRLLFAAAVVAIASQVVADGCWTKMSPPNSPRGRARSGMTYDSESDRAILFGGEIAHGGILFSDTWAYDYNTDRWTEMKPGAHPCGRYSPAVAYDGESDRVILFGGVTGGYQHLADTWAYDYNTNTWEEMNPANRPSRRQGAAMAYDAESDRIVLFGGGPSDWGLDDTWAYDYSTDTWEQMTPGVHPSFRYHSGMAYDAESDRVILFGGWDGDQKWDDTWAYDYNADVWEEMSPAGDPGARQSLEMAYYAAIDRTIAFGGHGPPSDTCGYDYDTNTWVVTRTDEHPSGRANPGMAYDAESERVIVCGGMIPGGAYSGETWAFEAAAFCAPEEWLWPGWNWVALPAVPCGPEPTGVFPMDCGGRIWYWDKYGKWAQVYRPPFVTFGLQVGESYLLWVDEVPDAVWHLGTAPHSPFEFKMGHTGWTWLGKLGLGELGGDDFMDTVLVKYPSDETGEVRTAREDWESGEDAWLSWGWSWWNAREQAPRTFTPYSPFGDNVCYPWVGYRCWINVGTALDESYPDQVTLIWP